MEVADESNTEGNDVLHLQSTNSNVEETGISFTPLWIKAFESEGVKDLRSMIYDLMDMFLSPNGYNSQVICSFFMKILLVHGVRVIKSGNLKNNNKISSRLNLIPQNDHREKGNIAKLIRQLSEVTKHVSFSHFILQTMLVQTCTRSKYRNAAFSEERLDIWKTSSNNYLTAMERLLSSNTYLRVFRQRKLIHKLQNMEVQEISTGLNRHTMTVHATYMAVQTVLQNRRTPIKFLGEQLIQLGHAHVIQLNNLLFQNDVLGHLTEILICSLGLHLDVAQKELCDFLFFINKRNLRLRFNVPWTAWSILSKFERSDKLQSINPLDIARLVESIDTEQIGIKGTVFIEKAAKIWKAVNEDENEIIREISNFTRTNPSLGPRMVQLVVDYDMKYEVDSLVEDMCSDNKLHPSEPLWLKYVEKRIGNLNRYGAIEETIKKCLKIVFDFLDFGTNRNCPKAWRLLHDVVQKASREMVVEQWRTRYDWWPKMHKVRRTGRDRFKDETIERMRTEVLEALRELTIQNEL